MEIPPKYKWCTVYYVDIPKWPLKIHPNKYAISPRISDPLPRSTNNNRRRDQHRGSPPPSNIKSLTVFLLKKNVVLTQSALYLVPYNLVVPERGCELRSAPATYAFRCGRSPKGEFPHSDPTNHNKSQQIIHEIYVKIDQAREKNIYKINPCKEKIEQEKKKVTR